MKTVEEYRKEAMENFRAGYNCAQAVLITFAEELGMDKDLHSGHRFRQCRQHHREYPELYGV